MVTLLRQHKRRQMEDMLFMGSEYHNDDLVCCKSDGTAYNPGSFSHRFNDFLKKHGLREIRLHDIRHSNASLMLKYNVPAKVASQRLGHSSIGITLDLYSHVLGDMETEAASKIDEGIFKKLG
ncbi:MAG: tyrosine-type recombinase/integrase [Eubacteriales bacterium]